MLYLLVSLLTFYVYFVLKTGKAINLLEKQKYAVKKYFKALFKEPDKTFGLLELSFIFLILIALTTNEKVTGICTTLFYTGLCLSLLKEKTKFKLTTKNVRIFIITTLVFVAINIPIFIDCSSLKTSFITFNPTIIYYTILYVLMYLLWFVVGFAGIINKLFDKKKIKK